jgi:DNA-binding LacI/PurR family transcriptional regulator
MSPRHNNRPVTLATIAEVVGVSRMTVSNAYNRPDQLSPALREKILAAAQELGYGGPDPAARSLSRGETGSVGVVLDYALTQAFTDPATVGFLQGVAAGCEQYARGMALVPRIDGRDADLVGAALVDGFVLYCVPPGDPRFEAVRARRLPYVGVDFAPAADLTRVNIDDEGAARAVADHLVALGHRDFGIVLTLPDAGTTTAEAEARAVYHVEIARLAGWRAGLEAGGIDWGAVPVAGHDDFTRLLDRAQRPTAIIALSDVLALEVINAAAERGIDVPRELSVAGFDDIPEAALATPSLTTIRQPHDRKGSEAVRLLLEGEPPESVLLPSELVIRASTAPAP